MQMMIFINLFLPPFCTLYLFLKRKKIEFKLSVLLLFFYAIFVSMNIPITHIFMFAARKFEIFVALESGYYTLFAIVSSVIVYALFVVFGEFFKIEFKVEKK